MLCIWRICPVLFRLIGVTLLMVFSADAETFYHWEAHDGVPVYSNVSPPSGVDAFSQWTGVSSKSGQPESTVAQENASQEACVRDSEDAADPGADPYSTVSFLKDRIARRETSASHIETLLKSHPDDLLLRRQLQKKRQAIREDQLRLKLMAN